MKVPHKIIVNTYQTFLVLIAVIGITAAKASAEDGVFEASQVESIQTDSMKDMLSDVEFANQVNSFNANSHTPEYQAPWVQDANDKQKDGLADIQALFSPSVKDKPEEDPLAALQ